MKLEKTTTYRICAVRQGCSTTEDMSLAAQVHNSIGLPSAYAHQGLSARSSKAALKRSVSRLEDHANAKDLQEIRSHNCSVQNLAPDLL